MFIKSHSMLKLDDKYQMFLWAEPPTTSGVPNADLECKGIALVTGSYCSVGTGHELVAHDKRMEPIVAALGAFRSYEDNAVGEALFTLLHMGKEVRAVAAYLRSIGLSIHRDSHNQQVYTATLDALLY